MWLWVIIEPKDKEILSMAISKERNMPIAKRFLLKVIEEHGKNPVSTDGGTWYTHQACKFLKLYHHINPSIEKGIIERIMQYIKDRMESFDEYFPCKKNKCKLSHVKQCLNLFIFNIIKK
jgi:putative transposase